MHRFAWAVLLVAGCAASNPFVGTWELDHPGTLEELAGDSSLRSAVATDLESRGMSLDLLADRTLVIRGGSASNSGPEGAEDVRFLGTWESNGDRVRLSFENGAQCTAGLAEGRLVLPLDEERLHVLWVFRRSADG